MVNLLVTGLLVSNALAFYLPGTAPKTYKSGDSIPLLVNHLTPSTQFQHIDDDGNEMKGDKERMLYPYDYYHEKLHFCRPEKIEKQPESLGSVLFGERIYNSPFNVKMLEDQQCVQVCGATIPGDDAKFINKLIKNGFLQNWLVDYLPAARVLHDSRTNSNFYGPGFELGFVDVQQVVGDKVKQKVTEELEAREAKNIIDFSKLELETRDAKNIIDFDKIELETRDAKNIVDFEHLQARDAKNVVDFETLQIRDAKNVINNVVKTIEVPYFANHFDINIEYHDRGNGDYRVVGVIVNSASLDNYVSRSCNTDSKPLRLDETKDNKVLFTYSVKFTASDTPWATRWDKYLHIYDPKIQWFSLINFSVIVLLLASVAIHSLLRALRSDISRYNEFNLGDEFEEDSGWKLVHGDVFRTPKNSLLLSVLVGSGIQLFLMIFLSIILSALGILSPSSRGSLPTAMFMFYAIFGFVGSYTSMAIYKFFKAPYWKVNMLLTPILVPGIIFCTVVALNLFLYSVGSSDVIPLATLFFMLFLWAIFSLPFAFAGALIAFKKCNWDEHPTRTNEIARQIPFQPWFLKTVPATLIGGLISFGSIAVELYFIYSSLWFNKIFYMFGFLLFSFILFSFTTGLINIIVTYCALCSENWTWQWRSFFIGGLGCAFYIFIHSILFTQFKLGGFVTIVLYVGYSFLISFLTCIVAGSIGFMCSMFFVRKIFRSIKVD